MSKLRTLRRQLSSLRHQRQLVRWGTAYSSLASVALWSLATLFVIDVFFFKALLTSLDVFQRVILIAIAAGVCGIAFYRLTWPLLGQRESETKMALMVERAQGIDSDLVAALQFESPDAARWGSRQLEDSVIDSVSQLGTGLNVFEGFSKRQMIRRAATLGITVAILLMVALAFSSYAGVFFNRLLLGSRHYPTNTTIDQIVINHNAVFDGTDHQTRPLDANTAQGEPVSFTVQCRGRVGGRHSIGLTSLRGPRRSIQLNLAGLSDAARLSRLRDARNIIQEALDDELFHMDLPWANRVDSLVRFDAPEVAAQLAQAKQDPSKLPTVATHLDQAIEELPQRTEASSILIGQLDRMIDPVQYTVQLGDAWTDAARISMISLPVVEMRLKVTPPAYAKSGWQPPADPNSRQLSVLEGSRVDVAIECTNGKSLSEAWITLHADEKSETLNLRKADEKGITWTLPIADTPLTAIRDQLRFEIQATDTDGLQTATPISGVLRIKSDRGPIGTASVVRNVYVPEAVPTIDFSVNDDYGIAEILLHVAIDKPGRAPVGDEIESGGEGGSQSLPPISLIGKRPILRNQLPFEKSYSLSLSSLSSLDKQALVDLSQGDSLKLTLEVVDYRGKLPGESYLSEPIYLELSSISDVFAVNTKDDERALKTFDEIKNKLFE